jgi:hypothetical protein
MDIVSCSKGNTQVSMSEDVCDTSGFIAKEGKGNPF